jgi:hypothetical protein
MSLETSLEDDKFFAELDVHIRTALNSILEKAKQSNAPVYGFSFGVPEARPVLTKYGLTEKFDFYVKLSGGSVKIEWLYNDCDLKPETHWIQQDNHGSFSNLECFREAIKQDTSTPDMKQLEIDRGAAKPKRIKSHAKLIFTKTHALKTYTEYQHNLHPLPTESNAGSKALVFAI